MHNQPSYGYEMPPSLPYNQPRFTPPPEHKKPMIAFAMIPVVLALIIGGLVWWHSSTALATPEQAFADFPAVAASTKSVTQHSTDTSGDDLVLKYDVHDVKHPVTSAKMTYSFSKDTPKTTFESYATFDDTYIKYTSDPSSFYHSNISATQDKWIQTRKDGKEVEQGVAIIGFGMVEPRYIFFGDVIFGSFSKDARKQLADFTKKHPLMAYDKTAVSKEELHGRTVYVYQFTINAQNLKDYNTLAGKLAGLSTKGFFDISDITSDKGTLYIDAKTKQLLKFTGKQDGETSTTEYSNYNTTDVIAKPAADMQWTEFSDAIAKGTDTNGTSNTDNADATNTPDTSQTDTSGTVDTNTDDQNFGGGTVGDPSLEDQLSAGDALTVP